jgi:hypothetical protein
VNDQATLLAYLAFSCLQKLMPKAQLVALYPQTPYTTLGLQLPFKLQDPLTDILKENLRGIIKQKSYQIFEMVPQVALSYAASKKIKVSIDEDQPLVTLLETQGTILEIQEGLEDQNVELSAHFDLFKIQEVSGQTYLTLVFGQEVKRVKKQGQLASEFKLVPFLQEAGVLSACGTFLDRGLALLDYYQELVVKPFYAIGCQKGLGVGDSQHYITTKTLDQGYEDPVSLPGLTLSESLIFIPLPLSFKKVNLCIKELYKVLNLINIKFELTLYGQYSDHQFRELSLGLGEFNQCSAQYKQLVICLIDTYGRFEPIVRFNFSKKQIGCEIYLTKFVLGSVLEFKKLYPDNLPRPVQKAIIGDLTQHPLLVEALFEARLRGENAFFLKKEALSGKEALDYQIDDLIYCSESEKVITQRSFS